MLNHIAVILRGHVRTWKFIYPYVFEFYDSLAYKVDYYFVSIQGCQENTNIFGIFEGRHLEQCLLLRPSKDFTDSYKNSSYYSYMILPYKKRREKEVKYDLVIDSRPDVIPLIRKNVPIIKPEPNILYTTQFDLHHNVRYQEKDIAVADWFFASTSEVYDQMSHRWIEENDQTNQITVRTYAEKCGFHVNRLPYARAFMARPNIIDAILPDGTLDHDKLSPLCANWVNVPVEEKKRIMEKNNIPFENYMTGASTCSI